jgi:hypothetical protein
MDSCHFICLCEFHNPSMLFWDSYVSIYGYTFQHLSFQIVFHNIFVKVDQLYMRVIQSLLFSMIEKNLIFL